MRTKKTPTPFFVHIPKTAGHIIKALITLNYDPDRVLSVYGNFPEIMANLAGNIKNKNNYDLVQGHMPYGAHYQLNIPDPRYFVFLREPVDRTMSDIAYALRAPHHGFHHKFAESDKDPAKLVDLAKGIHYYRNNMTNFVSGLFFTREATLTDLHLAIDNLWKSEVVGVTDAFEESMLIMAKRLGWKKVIVERLNTSPSKIEISDELRSSIRQVLSLDIALYAVAQDIADQQIRQYGAFLREAAEQLREIYIMQKKIAPEREYEWHTIGDKLHLHEQLEALVPAASPLGRWISEIAPCAKKIA
ncbi:MAG: sulfotransferase family protein [Gammaproteobacteria bacterium]|nr:sulfotransferase family protein [Gammaproteobacteria bacterium]MBU1775836.1 sulfotransferase family protein [Gammaproteobacteria bacterium]MBU1968444.1 sulfotransferase family protein [Gammaproteobacteria bacterium]